MSRFHYQALDQRGKLQKGSLEAETAKEARQQLREKNLIPTEVKPFDENKTKTKGAFKLGMLFNRHRLNSKELTLLTRQLATLFGAGLPISEVLTAVCEQSSKPETQSLLLSVKSKVLSGHSLAAALREHPGSFSPLFCGLIASGEQSGKLAPILQGLAHYTEEQAAMRQKILYALIYPGALLTVSFSIVLFLLTYVVPKMTAVYSHLNQDLPLLTKILINLSQGLKTTGIYLVLAALGGIYLFRSRLKKSPLLREKLHQVLLRLPLFGKTLQTLNTGRYARTLALLSSSGIPLLQGMHSASQLLGPIPLRKALETATQKVREGAALHLALKQTAYFSPMSLHLIASGEASGQLAPLLERCAEQQEDEIKNLLASLLALFEPALIILMGSLVLFIVLAVLLPIFDLNQLAL